MTAGPTIVLTHHLPPQVQRDMVTRWDLVQVEGSGVDLMRVLRSHSGARGIISFLSEPVTREVMAAGPQLSIVANYAVGYNNIDVAAALSRGIWVTHTPDVLTEATADLTLALLLAVARRLVEGDRMVRQGRFQGWAADLLLGQDLQDARLGILGLGRIGTAVARRAAAFGMQLAYHSRTRKPEAERLMNCRYVEFDELVETSDVLSLHLPYSDAVHHLVDSEVLKRMRPGSILINVARGALVDEDALVQYLESGHLGGAGLDVFEHEPRVHPRLPRLDTVVMAPHAGSATHKVRTRMARMVEESVTAALAGRRPPHLIPEWSREGE